MRPPRCGWWARRRHRRLRALDEALMGETIRRQTAWMEPAAKREQRRQEMWTLFCSLEGQEHWRCACAEADGVMPPNVRAWAEGEQSFEGV